MKLALIVPIHNEEANVHPFTERAVKVLDSLPDLDSWRIVFVNDGSTDGSLDRILELCSENEKVKVITLSRNFGYHSVLAAGLSMVESDLYAIVDVDGEDPPELLSEFYEAVRKGAQVAYGIRYKRDEPWLITRMRGLFYHINHWIADSPTVLWMAEFLMMTREVRDAVLKARSTYPFLRAEIAQVGFRRTGIEYWRSKRMHGETHYNLWTMTKFAIGGFLSSSTFPLRFILYISAVLAAAFPAVVFGLDLSAGRAAVLAAVMSFYFLLATLPLLALYLARTYKNGMARPVFYVDQSRTRL